jgi:hypothetical protein
MDQKIGLVRSSSFVTKRECFIVLQDMVHKRLVKFFISQGQTYRKKLNLVFCKHIRRCEGQVSVALIIHFRRKTFQIICALQESIVIPT